MTIRSAYDDQARSVLDTPSSHVNVKVKTPCRFRLLMSETSARHIVARSGHRGAAARLFTLEHATAVSLLQRARMYQMSSDAAFVQATTR